VQVNDLQCVYRVRSVPETRLGPGFTSSCRVLRLAMALHGALDEASGARFAALQS